MHPRRHPLRRLQLAGSPPRLQSFQPGLCCSSAPLGTSPGSAPGRLLQPGLPFPPPSLLFLGVRRLLCSAPPKCRRSSGPCHVPPSPLWGVLRPVWGTSMSPTTVCVQVTLSVVSRSRPVLSSTLAILKSAQSHIFPEVSRTYGAQAYRRASEHPPQPCPPGLPSSSRSGVIFFKSPSERWLPKLSSPAGPSGDRSPCTCRSRPCPGDQESEDGATACRSTSPYLGRSRPAWAKSRARILQEGDDDPADS